MTINIPSHYILTKTSTPNLEVQILHKTDDNQKSTHKYLMLSEMYMVSKFKHRIETLLHPYFNPNLSNGHIIETSKIIKTLQEFPVNFNLLRCLCIKVLLILSLAEQIFYAY
jgi:hypothetical protein